MRVKESRGPARCWCWTTARTDGHGEACGRNGFGGEDKELRSAEVILEMPVRCLGHVPDRLLDTEMWFTPESFFGSFQSRTLFFFLFIKVPRLGMDLELQLRPTPQPQQHWIWATSVTYTAACGNTGSLAHWSRPGIKPRSNLHPHRDNVSQVLDQLSHDRNSWA